jgi:hypothetical protein
MERRSMPLSAEAPFLPLRGRYCADDACLSLGDIEAPVDSHWDYSGFNLRRPVPCPSGSYCHPGTAVGNFDATSMKNLTTPQPCMESMYCPEGSGGPGGIGDCPLGFYCPAGIRLSCPAGTYCPRSGLSSPLACPPGTFNGQVSQKSCTPCPRGYICPGFGRIAPASCPRGMVCSRSELASPNLRCPPGYYCLEGTQTADPFRNDTVVRPYPCDPGTYCLGGVGSREIVRDIYDYAQPCPPGFYCESASSSPRGSGLCPVGFYCPEGTAVPIPTPKGHFASLEGMVKASPCLPGFYAPTIESVECYPCPPGSACEEDGTSIAEICPPGTYRSTVDEDGVPCAACPQGTWSKQWELREIGECQMCPPGVICSVEGMTEPCSRSDLPTPFEPIVSLNGAPAVEYSFSRFANFGMFSAFECLRLNDGYANGLMDPMDQIYFFGELVPPFIDALGRGAHLRPTGVDSTIYGSPAQCYRNLRPYGSKVYQRVRDYYGPLYDIQTGTVHQGYGSADEDYAGFFDQGSLVIPLPTARYYDASFNCTPGMQLRGDVTEVPDGVSEGDVVYTNPHYDPYGEQRRVYNEDDIWYMGTCEADLICETQAATQSKACSEGYVCDERTTSERSTFFPCHSGYVCDSGTTPDPLLESPEGQFTKLCPAGYVCQDATGLGQAFRQTCPANHFCPSGTADPLMGMMANDALNRGLTMAEASPWTSVIHVGYLGDDNVRISSAHDVNCFGGADASLRSRNQTRWLSAEDPPASLTLDFLRDESSRAYFTLDLAPGTGERRRPSIIDSATEKAMHCGRDSKWSLVADAIQRRECDCIRQSAVVASVYRFWMCTGASLSLDDLGLGSIAPPHNGGRDSWFPRKPHPGTPLCTYTAEESNSGGFSLDAGVIQWEGYAGLLLDDLIGGEEHAQGMLEVIPPVQFRLSWNDWGSFETFEELKDLVEQEYLHQKRDLSLGLRDAMDPYMFDLGVAIQKVQEHGALLPDLIWVEGGGIPGRLDSCECERLLKCPNGTISSPGASSILKCEALESEVLRRINAVPDRYMLETNPNLTYNIANGTDFVELTGGGLRIDTLGAVRLDAWQAATVTIDASALHNNFTYGLHYRLGAYIDCKPCPARYVCEYETATPTCSTPKTAGQEEVYEVCLANHRIETCYSNNATIVSCDSENASGSFMAPDFYKCRTSSLICEDRDWPAMVWHPVLDQDGRPENGRVQEELSYFIEEPWREGSPPPAQLSTPGCCQCESHSLPAFFDDDTADAGFPDNKHNIIQFSVTALQPAEVTVALELFHGGYYPDFDEQLYDVGEMAIFTPSRASYHPDRPSSASFLFLMEKKDYSNLELPLNLPLQRVRQAVGGASTIVSTFENTVLIDRSYNVSLGDPDYPKSYNAYLARKAFTEGKNASFTDYDELNPVYAVREDYTSIAQEASWWVSGDPDGENDFLTIPYLPFLSNCAGYGRHMGFARLVETHPECRRISYEQTRSIGQWTAVGADAFADSCSIPLTPEERLAAGISVAAAYARRGVYLSCTYEELLTSPTPKPRWYETGPGEILFYVTQNPMEPSKFGPSFAEDGSLTERWGRTSDLERIRGSTGVVPVEVSTVKPGVSLTVPRHIKLAIEYYQTTRGTKRMVSMTFEYSDLCTVVPPREYGGNPTTLSKMEERGIYPCEVDVNGDIKDYGYTLEVEYLALGWWNLLNAFEFDYMLYVAFFTVIGIISISEAAIIWALNRLLTKLRHPPPFHGSILFSIIAEAPTQGALLAAIPCMLVALWIWLWFGKNGMFASDDPVNYPSKINFEGVTGSWLDNLALDEDRIELYRNGRMGTCFICVMLYLTILCSTLLVPDWGKERAEARALAAQNDAFYDDDDELPPSSTFAPMLWKRANMMLASMCMQGLLLYMWEFSYSDTFSSNVYLIIVVFKFVQMLLDLVMEGLMRELLLVAPLLVVIGVTEALVTMGANDFRDFIVSFFVELSLMMLERLYLDPGLKRASKLWPRWRMLLRRKLSKRRRMTREEKASEEMEWRSINEKIELESEGVEPLLDSYFVYATEVLSLFLQPVAILLIMIFSGQTMMPSLYGIRSNEMVYYLAFATIIIPFSLLMDVFVLNTLELAYGWRVYDYVAYQKYRFSVREYRWMLRNEALDESVSETMQTLDLMCFSGQFYFVNALFGMGMIYGMLGITIFLRWDFNMFGDPTTPLIMVIMFLFGDTLQRLLRRLADIKVKRAGWRGLWMTKNIEGTVDDDIAAKLAIGEGRQADLEQERMELQALNSERFRHRFIDRNRPWVLQHLSDLLTPRQLDTMGPDGRPVVEYVRDIYADLMAQGEGARRPGDRSDISSDEEDEMEKQRRNWPREPLQGSSLAIARLWLSRARRRRAFSKLVTGIIQNNLAPVCSVCDCGVDKGRTLAVSLATGGKADPYAIDRLIYGFEEQYGAAESDANLWKAYFRANAQYVTTCDRCMDRVQHESLRRAGLAGQGRQARAADMSSDEDEGDGVMFDAVVVTHDSPEGRMMSKWLNAARRKMGGLHLFPREDARAQMERYVEGMRRRKLQGGKQTIAGVSRPEASTDPRSRQWKVRVNAAGRALAQRWLRLARDAIDARFKERGTRLREDVTALLLRMRAEDDWFFGADMRLEGEELASRGQTLSDDRRALEAQETIKIRKFQADLEAFEAETRDSMAKDRQEFEDGLGREADRVNLEIEIRTRELVRMRDLEETRQLQLQEATKAEAGAVPTTMLEEHSKALEDIDDLIRKEQLDRERALAEEETKARIQFKQKEALAGQALVDRKVSADNAARRVKRETQQKIKAAEIDWQSHASKWMGPARRKVELKDKEDLEEAAREKRRR